MKFNCAPVPAELGLSFRQQLTPRFLKRPHLELRTAAFPMDVVPRPMHRQDAVLMQ